MEASQRIPLAERMRPTTLSNVVGQDHLVGPKGALTAALASKKLPSLLFWGPPGVGKTTLSFLLAQAIEAPFTALSAISSGVKEVRDVLQTAERKSLFSQGNGHVLFIDEIHRFSKTQQDALLGAVEKGIVTLIGATTENPSFEVIPALLSRCQLYVLKALTLDDLHRMGEFAMSHDAYLQSFAVKISEWDVLTHYSGGDGRKMLNQLEWVVEQAGASRLSEVTNAFAEESLSLFVQKYDKGGDQHYDMASALIKSIRGSDPDAALYWAARMLSGGEPPEFIARRLLISASEDVGNANPNALILANTCFESVAKIGMPEARIILGQTIVYLACSPKSNASYLAMDAAIQTAEKSGPLPVPLHLRNAPTQTMKSLDFGKGYRYPHDFPGNFIEQNYFPEALENSVFYHPGNNDREQSWLKTLQNEWPHKNR